MDGRPPGPCAGASRRCSTLPWPGWTPSCPRGPRSCSSGRRGSSISNTRSFTTRYSIARRWRLLARGRSPDQVRRALIDRGVTHVYVDWHEIERYRSPGNYGFTPFVTPELFAGLVAAGSSRASPVARCSAGALSGPTRMSEGRRRMEAMTIVTGGAGFIGSHLVERLVARGDRVRVVERPGADTSHLPAGVEMVRADIRDPRAVGSAMRGGRWVFHLAANPNLWARDRGEFDAVNHRGTVHVLDAALAAGAERVLHTSTESILTRARGRRPDRRGCRDRPGGRRRAVLPVEAPGRERGDGPRPGGPSGRRGQPDDAGRAGGPRALAAVATDPRLLPGEAARPDGLHPQPDRRPRRGRGADPHDGAGNPRPPLPARRREPDAARPA